MRDSRGGDKDALKNSVVLIGYIIELAVKTSCYFPNLLGTMKHLEKLAKNLAQRIALKFRRPFTDHIL